MEELPQELKTMIHHILVQNKFYHLEFSNYHEILQLLRQPLSDDPRIIQQNIFKGIVEFNIFHRDQIAPVLANPINSNISMQMRTFLHRILHEFHFLNSVKAYELFQERYQQPAELSEAQVMLGLPFDDQFQKARLHYMYYGPYSVYNMGGMLQQQPLSMPYSQPYFTPSHLLPTDKLHFTSQNRTPQAQKDLNSNKKTLDKDREFGMPIRGRPPKDRKKQLQRLQALRMTVSLKSYLQAHHRPELVLEERDESLQYCVCRGFLNNLDTYKCPKCNNIYHYSCCKSCLACFMRDRDPLRKVMETVTLFYMDWWAEEYTYQTQINVRSLQRVCSTGRFEIMISCVTPTEKDITWPDRMTLSLNEQQILEIPPLLVDHTAIRRKDSAYFITPYVFRESHFQLNLEKMQLSISTNKQYGHKYRDNRKNVFLVGVFLVEKIAVKDLMKEIIQESRPIPTFNPLEEQANQEEEIQIDRLAISCYDPYSKKLIQTPVKGNECQHYNCFDLQTFLAFQQASQERSWHCPFCGKDARKLIVDKFQLRIIQGIRDLPRLPARLIYHHDGKIDLEEAQLSEDSDQEIA